MKTNIDKKEKLIKLKLDGCLDSYDAFSKEVNKEKEDIQKLGGTLKKIVQNYYEISDELFAEFEEENKNIQYIKSRCTHEREEGFGSKYEFYKWYVNEPKKCCYCGVDENSLREYFENNQDSKRFQRGRSLEIERILTDENNNNYSKDNCSLACYICNNAKSDLIHYKDFKFIAEGINKFWNNEFENIKIDFPNEFYTKDIKGK